MKKVLQLFDLYIQGSIHVAVAVLSLVLMTNHMFHKPFNVPMAGFAFFGTLFGYNFMKYEGVFRYKKPVSIRLKIILWLSGTAFVIAGLCFLFLQRVTQVTAVIFFCLMLLYTVPFFPNRSNMRNWSGIKIYIVAFCWAGVTLLLPLLNAGLPLYTDVFLKFGQRFLLVIILILIFEVIDLREDDPHLKTIPQVIGVRNTKMLNLFLLVPLYFLEFLRSEIDTRQLLVNAALVIVTGLFTVFAHPGRSKYYTLLWVEGVPVLWLGMVVLADSIL